MPITHFILTDPKLLYGPWDASGDHNETKISEKVDMLECSPFGVTEHRWKQGLRSFEIESRGYANFDDSITPKAADFQAFDSLTAGERAFTVAYTTADGAPAWLGKALTSEYLPELKNDQLGMFNLKLKGNQHVRGRIILPHTSRVAAAGPGAIHALGALTSAQKLLVALHITEFVGATITFTIKSNDTNDTVTPTTRHTFSAATAAGAQYAEISGAITDTFWYVDWAFTGTSFKAAVSAGIR